MGERFLTTAYRLYHTAFSIQFNCILIQSHVMQALESKKKPIFFCPHFAIGTCSLSFSECFCCCLFSIKCKVFDVKKAILAWKKIYNIVHVIEKLYGTLASMSYDNNKQK